MRSFARYCALVVLVLFATTCSDSVEPLAPVNPVAHVVPGDPIVVAAGDLVCGVGTPANEPCKYAETAALVTSIAPTAVLLLGDIQYEGGFLSDFNTYYEPTWGVHKSITHPAPGNHEYHSTNANGYFDYFNGPGVQTGPAGTRGKGYYSFNLGAWHIIALNSNCTQIGGCGAGSLQETWLRADLAANPTACTLAYWHHPRFSSGHHGNNSVMQALWTALDDYDADLVLAGHDHAYERFARQNSVGTADPTSGIRSFVVGVGGKELKSFPSVKPNSEVRDSTSFGVLKLTLHATSFDWQFVPIPGHTLADAGTASCVSAAPPNQKPVPAFTQSWSGPVVTFDGSSSTDDNAVVSYTWRSVDPNRSRPDKFGVTTTRSADSPPTSWVEWLIVSDSAGLVDSTSQQVVPPGTPPPPPVNQKPVAAFTMSWSGTVVTFNGSSSTDDDAVVSYTWRSVDPNRPRPDKFGVTTTRSADTPPTSWVEWLIVSDSAGQLDSTSQQVVPPAAPPTTLTFSPSADAHTTSSSPNSNFGSATTLLVDGTPSTRSYFKFTVSGIGSKTVLSAKLRLYAVDPSTSGGRLHRVTSTSWTETGIQWSNQPAYNSTIVGTIGSVATGSWYEVDVKSVITASGTYAFALESTVTNGVDYVSRQGASASRPQLVIVVQ